MQTPTLSAALRMRGTQRSVGRSDWEIKVDLPIAVSDSRFADCATWVAGRDSRSADCATWLAGHDRRTADCTRYGAATTRRPAKSNIQRSTLNNQEQQTKNNELKP